MSFGFGPATDMHKKVQSLRRSRTSTLEKIKTIPHTNPSRSEGCNDTPTAPRTATPEALDCIRERLQREQQRDLLLKVAAFVGLLLLVFYFLFT